MWVFLQTRDALEAILKDLHKEDHFALIVFDSVILTWRDSLTKATTENLSEAIAYVRKIRDKGGESDTNLFCKMFCTNSLIR